jgi:hypothetical protein
LPRTRRLAALLPLCFLGRRLPAATLLPQWFVGRRLPPDSLLPLWFFGGRLPDVLPGPSCSVPAPLCVVPLPGVRCLGGLLLTRDWRPRDRRLTSLLLARDRRPCDRRLTSLLLARDRRPCDRHLTLRRGPFGRGLPCGLRLLRCFGRRSGGSNPPWMCCRKLCLRTLCIGGRGCDSRPLVGGRLALVARERKSSSSCRLRCGSRRFVLDRRLGLRWRVSVRRLVARMQRWRPGQSGMPGRILCVRSRQLPVGEQQDPV